MTRPDSATIIWKIENFENYDSSWTSSDIKTQQAKFYLKLYPYDDLKWGMENHIGIYLFRHKPYTTDLKVLYTISLLREEEKECYTKEIETNFTVESGYDPIDGGSYNLDRHSVLQPWNGLLRNGDLTIKCTVTVLDCQKRMNTNEKIILAQKNVLQNFQTLLENSKYSDVVFVIGKKEFKLHKNILASQSPVFAAMFDSELEEAKQNQVCITDVNVEVFEALIRFIYTANVDSVQQYALDLFVAADKYQLDSLKDICVDHLCSNLTIDSVANILLVADMHSAKELKSKCVDYISKNASEVVVSEGWRQLIKRRHELVFELYQDLAAKSKFGKQS